jgi:novobiocin biosynthesis protein NovU/D-mycarose 3-C-methyltransferase
MLCRKVGLNILSVEHKDIHGGSVRVTIDHEFKYSPEVDRWMNNEVDRGYLHIAKYYAFAAQVRYTIQLFSKRLSVLSQMHRVYAFGASAKGNTLLNSSGITNKEIVAIFDETPEKQYKFSPGTGIIIYPLHGVFGPLHTIEYIVLLAWNFKDECIKKCRDAGYKGKFILPLTFEIIE